MKFLLQKFFTYIKDNLVSFFKKVLNSVFSTLKDVLVKYFLFLLKAVTIIGVCYFVYFGYKSKQDTERKYNDLIGKQEDFKKINDYVADLEKKYTSEKQLREKLEKNWIKEKEYLKGMIKVISEVNFELSTKESEGKVSLLESNKLIEISPVLKDNSLGPPLCYVRWDEKDKIYKKVYDFEIKVNTAISKDENNGKYNILTKADLILTEKPLSSSEWYNKPYPVKISNGYAVIDPSEKITGNSFYWFDPKLNAGINFGLNGSNFYTRPSIGVSWMGYGLTKNDLKWKFLNTGIDFNTDLSNVGINFMPFVYRPFDSFITNTYLGPGVNYSISGTSYFLGISLGL